MKPRSLVLFPRHRTAAAMRGFSLIEMMIAMVLGLVVMAGVGSVFLSNQKVYRTNKALSDVQDSARVAFEMLARDIRHAGLTACSNSGRVANVLNVGPAYSGSAAAPAWWGNWNNAVRGFDGNDTDTPTGNADGDRVAGKPSLQLLGGDEVSYSVASHDSANAQFTLNEASTELGTGDVFIVCDYDHATIFKSSNVSATAKTVSHATTAGNCSIGLGYPTSCGSANFYTFGANAYLTRLNVADWYIGKNADGGTSLYRLGRAGGTPTRQEMVRGVTDLQFLYHQNGLATFVKATNVTNWGDVTAVQATLTMEGGRAPTGAEQPGTDNAPLSRRFTVTTTVRNNNKVL